jgi:hypothetical protein
MRLVPVRLLSGLLLPTDQGCFVTPLQEPSHYLAVRSGEHKGFNRGFGGPDGSSPIGVVSVTK